MAFESDSKFLDPELVLLMNHHYHFDSNIKDPNDKNKNQNNIL